MQLAGGEDTRPLIRRLALGGDVTAPDVNAQSDSRPRSRRVPTLILISIVYQVPTFPAVVNERKNIPLGIG